MEKNYFWEQMKVATIILFLAGWITFNFVSAQNVEDEIDPMPITLKGQIINMDDGLPLPYAHVVNMRTHGGTTTDVLGKFTLDMLNVDSLAVSIMGFKTMYVHVDPKHNLDELYIIKAAPIRFAIKEVTVKGDSKEFKLNGIPDAKPVNIDPHLRGDAFNSKPPLIAAFFTPLSFLQYYLSKNEKEKREMRKAIVSEERWQLLSQYYTKDIVMSLTGLNETDADRFMIYFNSKGILNTASSEYDIRAAIIEQYNNYILETNTLQVKSGPK